jgi:two-component system CheB/CheR fusion protein
MPKPLGPDALVEGPNRSDRTPSTGGQFDGQLLGVYDVLLSKFMPPSLLVNERQELVQSFAGASRYLKHREGRYSPNVLEMVDPDLRMALTGALQRTLTEYTPVAYKGIRVTLPEGEQLLNVAVEPIRSPRSGLVHALISLEQAGTVPASPPAQVINRNQASREQVLSLEAESRRKDQQMAGILKNSPNPLSITDLEGRYVVTDEAFQELVGSDPIGKTAQDVFPQQAADVLTACTQQVITSRSTVQTEVVIEEESGSRTYLTILFPLQEEQGSVSGVGVIMTDVTPLKQAESRALEAVTQRDRFLAMLSHELRNPLAAILNSTSALELAPPGSGLDRELVRVIDRRAQHMARLLDDLLDVARLTQNKIEIRKSVFDLGTTMDGVIEETRSLLETRRIDLVVHRPDFPLLVSGDPARLQQIQVNLLLNAAKYTPEGGHVWYSVGREEDQAVIRVRDDGVGIAADMLDRVFDLFVQAVDPTGRVGGGIGVGLTMVRSIVQLHGGRVKASSDGPGKGSEFIVWLPLAREAVPAPRLARLAGPEVDQRFAGCKVLLVEDDADIRNTLRAILEHDGFQVQAAADAASALALLEQGLPEAVLLDLGLPGMNGYELALAVRQRFGPNGPRLVALTGYGQAADRQATQEAGFDAHLTKPLKPRDLYEALNSLLAGDSQ